MEAILNDWILPHWPFFTAMAIFAVVGQVMKSVVTKDMATKNGLARVFRVTLPLHPVVTGLAIGYLQLFPTSGGVAGPGASALYYGAAGVLSSWMFYAVKRYLRKRGIRLPEIVPSERPKKGDTNGDGDDDLDDRGSVPAPGSDSSSSTKSSTKTPEDTPKASESSTEDSGDEEESEADDPVIAEIIISGPDQGPSSSDES